MVIEVLHSINDVSCIKEEWEQLWRNQTKSCPYKSVDWNIAWITANSIENRINILLVREANGTLVGVAPLQRVPLIVPGLAALTFIGQESSVSPDFLVVEGREEEFSDEVLRYVSFSRNIKAMVLKMADPLYGAAPLLEHSFISGMGKVSIEQYSQRPIVELPDNYETFLQSLSSKMRQEMRAARKKLGEGRVLEFRYDGSKKDLAERLSVLFQLNDLRWKQSSGRKVYERLYTTLSDSNMLKVFTLYIDGHPMAGLSVLAPGDTVYAELAGFDYNTEPRHLGKGFYGMVIEWAIQNGYHYFDFSSGSEDYKLRFQPKVFPKYRLVFTSNPLGRFLLESSRKIGKRINRLLEPSIA
jgi:CelD/BcsL family acetyltransferase involved in cellulose biosynthesis